MKYWKKILNYVAFQKILTLQIDPVDSGWINHSFLKEGFIYSKEN